jgi:hypothetical protein
MRNVFADERHWPKARTVAVESSARAQRSQSADATVTLNAPALAQTRSRRRRSRRPESGSRWRHDGRWTEHRKQAPASREPAGVGRAPGVQPGVVPGGCRGSRRGRAGEGSERERVARGGQRSGMPRAGRFGPVGGNIRMDRHGQLVGEPRSDCVRSVLHRVTGKLASIAALMHDVLARYVRWEHGHVGSTTTLSEQLDRLSTVGDLHLGSAATADAARERPTGPRAAATGRRERLRSGRASAPS